MGISSISLLSYFLVYFILNKLPLHIAGVIYFFPVKDKKETPTIYQTKIESLAFLPNTSFGPRSINGG